jgi:uncharacterized OsmC-like protein
MTGTHPQTRSKKMNTQSTITAANTISNDSLGPSSQGDKLINHESQESIDTVLVNGVNVAIVGAVIDSVRENPVLGQARFRAQNTWVSGAHNRTSMQGFYAAGGEDESREQAFVIDSDEPPLLGGANRGANAVELALTALASCLTGTLVYYGALMGIVLDEVSAELEGDLDMSGLFGLEETTRRGLQHVRVDYHIKSREPRERIVELLGTAQKFSPLNDIFTNPVPVSIRLVD